MKTSKWRSLKMIIYIVLLSTLIIVGITGCNTQDNSNPPENPQNQTGNEDTNDKEPVEVKNAVDDKLKDRIQIVEENDLEKNVKEWFEHFGETEGAYVFQHPDATYIKIITTEQPTGGYSIYIKDYLDDEYPKIITYEVIKPQEGLLVTEAFTYPSVILEVSSDAVSQYEVRNIDGDVLNTEEYVVFAQLELPNENEKISNPVRINGKILAFEGAFSVRILDDKENLIYEEHLQADSGGPNWGSFDYEINYPNTDASEGSIELGEYSAEDGEYILREKVSIRFK